jgi:transcriptional regulator with XRE-family HTH domain
MNTTSENTDWIGAWIRDSRKKCNMSQEALGTAMFVTKGNVSAWENSRHVPSINQLMKISQITGTPLPQEIAQFSRRQEEQTNHAIDLSVAMAAAGVRISPEAIKIAKAFDGLTNPSQRDAVIAQLRAFGALK